MAFFNITSLKGKSKKISGGDPMEAAIIESVEGQLAVDILETPSEIIVLAPIAGVKANNIKVSLTDDILTISGVRNLPGEPEENEQYSIQECYWGEFSRSIVLPSAVNSKHVKARFTDGILRIIIAKSEKYNTKNISVEE